MKKLFFLFALIPCSLFASHEYGAHIQAVQITQYDYVVSLFVHRDAEGTSVPVYDSLSLDVNYNGFSQSYMLPKAGENHWGTTLNYHAIHDSTHSFYHYYSYIEYRDTITINTSSPFHLYFLSYPISPKINFSNANIVGLTTIYPSTQINSTPQILDNKHFGLSNQNNVFNPRIFDPENDSIVVRFGPMRFDQDSTILYSNGTSNVPYQGMTIDSTNGEITFNSSLLLNGQYNAGCYISEYDNLGNLKSETFFTPFVFKHTNLLAPTIFPNFDGINNPSSGTVSGDTLTLCQNTSGTFELSFTDSNNSLEFYHQALPISFINLDSVSFGNQAKGFYSLNLQNVEEGVYALAAGVGNDSISNGNYQNHIIYIHVENGVDLLGLEDSYCMGDSVNLEVTQNTGNSSWDYSNGTNICTNCDSISLVVQQSMDLVLNTQGNCGAVSQPISIIPDSALNLIVADSLALCNDSVFNLNAQHHLQNILWSNSAGYNFNCNNCDTTTIIGSGNMQVYLQAESMQGCLNHDTVHLNTYEFNVAPVVDSVCMGDTVNIVVNHIGTSPLITSNVNFQSNSSANLSEYQFIVDQLIQVSIEETMQCSISTQIDLAPFQAVNLIHDDSLSHCSSNQAYVRLDSNLSNIQWQFASQSVQIGSNMGCNNCLYNWFQSAQIDTILVSASTLNGCSTIDSVIITPYNSHFIEGTLVDENQNTLGNYGIEFYDHNSIDSTVQLAFSTTTNNSGEFHFSLPDTNTYKIRVIQNNQNNNLNYPQYLNGDHTLFTTPGVSLNNCDTLTLNNHMINRTRTNGLYPLEVILQNNALTPQELNDLTLYLVNDSGVVVDYKHLHSNPILFTDVTMGNYTLQVDHPMYDNLINDTLFISGVVVANYELNLHTLDLINIVSSNDIVGQTFQAFPNPVNQVLTIQGKGNFDYQVVDMKGALIHSGSSTQKVQLNTDIWMNGVYLVKIETEQGMIIKKIIKN